MSSGVRAPLHVGSAESSTPRISPSGAPSLERRFSHHCKIESTGSICCKMNQKIAVAIVSARAVTQNIHQCFEYVHRSGSAPSAGLKLKKLMLNTDLPGGSE